MGPRIYPSQQDTNLTAKGSLILSLSNIYLNNIQVTVNGILRDVEYSNLNGIYTTNININDIVSILLTSTPNNYYKSINILRRDYTTDDVSGDYGIFDTSISNNVSYDTSGLTVTFTATTSNASYNFEYRVSASVASGTPTPTPTPSPTPTPPPFTVRSGANDTITDIIIDESDNIYLGGGFQFYDDVYSEPFTSAQYTKLYPNGGVFSGFSQDGVFADDEIAQINKLLFTNDNKVLVGGKFKAWWNFSLLPNSYFYSGCIIKMNKDSRTPYQGYPSSTATGSTQNGFGGAVNDMIQQSDNKFLIAGSYISYSGVTAGSIIRINDNGTIDNTFSIGTGFGSGVVYSLELQSDGKILCGGDFGSYSGTTVFAIVRLTTGGTRDTSFTSYFSGLTDTEVNIIQIQPDGKILCAGKFTSYNSVQRMSILRLNSNGTLDTTFGSTSGFTGPFILDGLYYGRVNDMILQSDGKILCGGDFTGYSGVSSNNIIRLNNDGTIDTTFNAGTGFNGPVYTLARQSTLNIMVGGDFTTYNGYGTFNNIARLSPDGGNNTLYDPLPTPTPTPTPTPSPTDTPTPTPSPSPTPAPPISINLQVRYIGANGSSTTLKDTQLSIVNSGNTYNYSGLTWGTSIDSTQTQTATVQPNNPTFSFKRDMCKLGASVQQINTRIFRLYVNGGLISTETFSPNITVTNCASYITQTYNFNYIGVLSAGDTVQCYLQDTMI